ncbi:hypothetical protein NDI76_01265 [Halogeometricum sp. S1BR25-6]|uniref:Uncharacterized protein n=1 Tax=Halogeometricum salsisoli TaxID=2950536 RepID=A0ABU2G979_9EURY|nr:hypothetical protein [Halogeometricum sp. S1BR25-6]MDS0297372.1 hypothetical protein [Halogeometricum sp. S1BR25-6]
MASQSTAASGSSLLSLPSNNLAYLGVVAALVSAVIHLYLAPTVMGFDPTTGVLFYLNALGWLVGVGLFFTRYWRRALHLVAAGYAVLTIVAYVAMGGPTNPMAIASKVAEAVVALVAGYFYASG